MNFNDIKNLPDIPSLLKNEGFKGHYIELYNDTHKNGHGAAHFMRETTYVKQMLIEDEAIRKATPLSMSAALFNLATYGVSIRKEDKALAYLYPRGGNNRVICDLSPYGGLAIRLKNKVITSISGPVLIMDGDDIYSNGFDVQFRNNFVSDKIIGAVIRINRPDRTHEDKFFSIAQILTYRDKSKSRDSVGWTGGVNGQPTKGMIEAKVLQHAMDTYPLHDVNAEAAFANTYAKLASGDDQTDMEALGTDYEQEYEEQTPPPPPPAPAKKPMKVYDDI